MISEKSFLMISEFTFADDLHIPERLRREEQQHKFEEQCCATVGR